MPMARPMSCGMAHPAVLENCHIDPEVYQGFAFGMGEFAHLSGSSISILVAVKVVRFEGSC